ncbi:MAG TPA: radical SAM protein [Bacteroidia bacterium]|nr:radical SAM protein [Bacteroidia bacterium]
MTSRCNLACSYCVLENAPFQLKQELDLDGKITLISHLYHQLNFRKLTLSGGEALLIGKNPPSDFVKLLKFLRSLKSKNPKDNLQIYLYTNGLKLNKSVAKEMNGVIDEVSITIDSSDTELLRKIGRNSGSTIDYFSNSIEVCKNLSDIGIKMTLHTVISSLNYQKIGIESADILSEIKKKDISINKWKFYQYMSYDNEVIDKKHIIEIEQFEKTTQQISKTLEGSGINFHFKDNNEMNSSLFNILPYGSAQYMIEGSSWSTTKRSEDLRKYQSIEEVFSENQDSLQSFLKFHSFNL